MNTPPGSDAGCDPETGLPDRESFLSTVREFRSTSADESVVGCLLVLELPSLDELRKRHGEEPVDAVVRDVLALVESRLRSRDTLGRLARDTLCILLRQCPEQEAEQVSMSFAEALAGFKLSEKGKSEAFPIRRRVIRLESLETLASRRPVSVSSTEKPLGFRAASNPKLPSATVHSFSQACQELRLADQNSSVKSASAAIQSSSIVGFGESVAPWRAEPAIRLGDPRTLIAYRLRSMQPPGLHRDRDGFQRAIMTLASSRQSSPRTPLPLLIVDMSHRSLNEATVQWVLDLCQQHRIGAESICIALSHRGWAGRLRDAMPPLKRLDRAGIGVLLDALEMDRHGEIIERLIRVDFRQLSSADVNVSANDALGTDRLRRRVRQARESGSKVIARGVDQESQIARLKYLGVDIGFGHLAGKSISLEHLCLPDSDKRSR